MKTWNVIMFCALLGPSSALYALGCDMPVDHNTLITGAPDYVVAQYGGYAGLGSVGLGYAWNDQRVSVEGLWGYAPAPALQLDVHALTIKLLWTPVTFRSSRSFIVGPILGAALHYGLTDQTQIDPRKNTRLSAVPPEGPSASAIVGLDMGLWQTIDVSFEYERALFETNKRDLGISYPKSNFAIAVRYVFSGLD